MYEKFDDIYSDTTVVASTATLDIANAFDLKSAHQLPSYVREMAYLSNGRMVNQSKPFPCAPDNTINVGLRLNVPLLTTCQHPQVPNVYNHTPAVSITGLYGSTTDSALLVITGDSPIFGGSSGAWSRNHSNSGEGSGTLTVTPSGRTVAGQLYYFHFNLVNRAEGQNAPAVSLEVDTLGCCSTANSRCLADNTGCNKTPSEHRFWIGTAEPDDWTLSPEASHFLDQEEVRPMFIRSAGFHISAMSTVQQSTSVPCAHNTITVSMHTTVPLYLACGVKLTVAGLTGMATPSMPNVNRIHPPGETNTTNTALTSQSWNQSLGELVVSVTADIIGPPDGRNAISFTFVVENPATGQDSKPVFLKGSFGSELTYDGEGSWEDNAGTSGVSTPQLNGGWISSGNSWDAQSDRGYTDASVVRSVAIWDSSKAWSSVSGVGYPTQNQYSGIPQDMVANGQDIPEPTDQAYFPGYVQHPRVAYAMAGQSSPWPCDINTITVIMQSNVPLLKRCQPIITVTNLRNVHGGGPSDKEAGEIRVKFHKTFKQGHIDASLTALMVNGSTGLEVNATFNKTGANNVGSLIINAATMFSNTAVAQGATGQDTVQFSFEVINRYHTGDGPLGHPQNELKIQFSLESESIPAVLAMSGRVEQNGNDTGSHDFTAETDSRASVHVDPRQVLYADFQDITHDVLIQNARVFPAAEAKDLLVKAGDARPLYLRTPSWTRKFIEQSSPYPCDDNNVITISLTSDVPYTHSLYCQPKITIEGLKQYVTASTDAIPYIAGSDAHVNADWGDSNGGNLTFTANVNAAFGATGRWNQTAGSLVLTLLAGKAMVAHDTYIFSVRLHNSHNGESNPSSAGGNLTVFVEQDDSTGVDKLYNEKDDFDYWGSNARTSDDLVADTASLTKEEAYAMTFKDLRPVYVREIRFEVRMVNQSKPFPCAPDNTINVGLRLNVPLLMTCKNPSTSSYDYIPAVSITGLKGTESRASHLNVVADGPFAGLSPWDRDSGRLTVKPNTETVAGETYYFAFDVWNPSQPLVSITQLQMGVEIIQRSFASASSECAATATLSCNTTYLTGVEFGFFSSTHESRAELQPMKIRPLVVLGTTRFAQSHPYPCASNSIAVTIVLSSPLYANCTPRFTIEGLTNTLTGDPNGNEVYLDLAVVQPATLMINGTDDSSGTPKGHWLNSGVLSLWITSDLLASESGLEKGYTQFSLNFYSRELA